MAMKLGIETGKRRRGRPSNAERAARAQAQAEEAQQNGQLASAGLDPLSNVSDATILEYIDQCEPLYQDMVEKREGFRQAQGKYRNLLKQAEQNNVIELDWLMKTRREDIGEVDRRIAARNRLAALGRLPIGSQLGFLPGQLQVTVAQVVDEAHLRERREAQAPRPRPEPAGPEPDEGPHEQPPEPRPAAAMSPSAPASSVAAMTGEFADLEEAKAYAQGGRARMFGRTLASNPYAAESNIARVWNRGWSDKDAGEARR